MEKRKMLSFLLFLCMAACSAPSPKPTGVHIEMVFVEGGTFIMGCTEERRQSEDCFMQEMPAHKVSLSNFYIGKYEITQAQWRAVMGINAAYFKNCDPCPVESVHWEDVQEFIQKLNEQTGKRYRLPTEAEWEYAARGGKKSKGYKYAGSNDANEVAWYNGNSQKPQPVGSKRPNELGIHDMSGNVWEWCSDWYAADYYEHSPTTNPRGPSSGKKKVQRGGSWHGVADNCRTRKRQENFNLAMREEQYGLRLVLEE